MIGTEPPRLDWCHLLPETLHWPLRRALLVGGHPELGNALLRLGVVTSVDLWPASDDGWDMIVVGPDAQLTAVDQTFKSLRPGGVAYVVRARTLRPRAHLLAAGRLLRRAGLREVGRWALLPGPLLPRRYLPLTHRGAWSWYLQCLFLAETPRARAARALLFVASCSPWFLQFIVPGSALMAVRDGITEECSGLVARPRSRTGVITSGYDRGSRTILLPFAKAAKWPSAVVKVATEPLLRDATRQEHERLRELREVLPPAVARVLPRPVGFSDGLMCTVSSEEAVRGPTMLTKSAAWRRNRKAAIDDLATIESWLLELHWATVKPPPPEPAMSWLYGPLARLEQFGPVPSAVSELILKAAEELCRIPRERLSSVLQHYDVGPWNIIRSRGELSILDWELDRTAGRDGFGPPFVDLLYFACYWYFLSTGRRTRGEQLEGLVQFFTGQGQRTWQAKALHDRLANFRRTTGIPASATWPLLLACWLERAVTAHRRWTRLGEVGAPDDSGLQYLRALAMHSDAMEDYWHQRTLPRPKSDSGSLPDHETPGSV